jgi:dihydrofolate reductase
MRKLIYGINISLDGCCDHTKFSGSEEVHDYFTQLMHDVDVLVYGRKTYQLMVPFWPDVAKSNSGPTKSMNEFAQAFDANKIVVFSQSLESAGRDNARIVRGNLEDEILKLKQEPGKDIATGGVDLPSQLIELGLVDEFNVVVHPIVVGAGRRLDGFSLAEKLQLQLVDSKIFKSGFVALRYLKQRAAPGVIE